MKKIISFLTLFAFFVMGFVHNSMMLFAMQNNIEVKIEKKNICCTDQTSRKNNKKCINICCVEKTIDSGIISINNSIQKKVSKTITNYDFLELNTLGLYSLDNKSLANKTSPPYYERDIINYSYHTLIKIIKSNT